MTADGVLTGWLGVLGWEVGVAFSSFLAGTQIQGLSLAVASRNDVVTSVNGSKYRSTGLELPGHIRLPELAWNSADDGYIVLVGHFQHLLCTEAPPCGMHCFDCSIQMWTNPYPRKVPC